MKVREFHVGAHIWFVLHVDEAGVVTGLEEHDWREGGHLPENPKQPYRDMFLAHVELRCGSPQTKEQVLKAARFFLEESELSRMTVEV